MATIKLKGQSDGQIRLTFGDPATATVYRVTDGVIVVSDEHIAAVLDSVPGSELMPEAPAKEK